MERLADVLEQKFPQFNTVSAHQSLRDALYKMSCENLNYLIVAEENEFVGILSEQDVAHKLFTHNKPLEELKVNDIMNCAIPVGNVTDDVAYATRLLNSYKSRYIAVFDDLEFKGIVSENDLLKQSVFARTGYRAAAQLQESLDWSY